MGFVTALSLYVLIYNNVFFLTILYLLYHNYYICFTTIMIFSLPQLLSVLYHKHDDMRYATRAKANVGLEFSRLGCAGEGDDVANVLHTRYEQDEALEAETKACVGA